MLYLQHHVSDRKLLVIGTKSLCGQFAQAGFDIHAGRPSAVVLGAVPEARVLRKTWQSLRWGNSEAVFFCIWLFKKLFKKPYIFMNMVESSAGK